ncbi:hypothetical protein FRC03_009659 [Tulasnella sp. 419]|nr:hypothetical protein FRC02_006322 [Tulasnella sp. 418]KAG8967630.1 hypothetical protein FRC03_009659 [Tulasnella sp. 419]
MIGAKHLSFVLGIVSLAIGVVGVPTIDLGYSPHSRAQRYGIQGADAIKAVGLHVTYGNPHLSSTGAPGVRGEAIIADTHSMPIFFLNSGRLYQYINQTTLLHVNVVEPRDFDSHSAEASQYSFKKDLLKLEISTKKRGVKGDFYYVMDSLHFGLRGAGAGKQLRIGDQKQFVVKGSEAAREGETNEGLWWVCEEKRTHEGVPGRAVYLDFKGWNFHNRPAPDGCEAFTFHSFGQDNYD